MEHLVIVSDGHQGDRAGICPPESVLDLGGRYKIGWLQEIIWEWWGEFRCEIDQRTKGNYILLVNGDWLEGDHHRTKNAFSLNLNDQLAAAMVTLGPLARRAKATYITRGTGAHAGQSAEWEEAFAREIGAVRDKNSGIYSRPALNLLIEDVLVNASHYIGVSGSTQYESSALMQEATRVFTECARWNRRVPDLIVRSHRHRHLAIPIKRAGGKTTIFTTAGWQLKTPYVYGIAGGGVSTPQIGGSIITIDGNTYQDDHIIHSIDQDPIEEIEIAKVRKTDRKPVARRNRPPRR